jgi:release factor glutamine methyltransferase
LDLVAVQHILPSTRLLLEAVQQSQLWENVEIAGKPYSTVVAAAREIEADFPKCQLRSSASEVAFDALKAPSIALDEGGVLARLAPHEYFVAGVEQTSSGAWGPWRWPTVLVCRSAAKLFFEAQIIARAIVRKLDREGLLAGRTVGVLGLGALGAELARFLDRQGYRVLGFDTKRQPSSGVDQVASSSELVARSDLVLGVTGRDSLRGVPICHGAREKVFASCSSSNVEFASILAELPRARQFELCQGWVGDTHCSVVNAGFPVNFDRQVEWEQLDEIWLTRMLCARALEQAHTAGSRALCGLMMSPVVQRDVVMAWLDRLADPQSLRIPGDLSVRFFLDNSEGAHAMTTDTSYVLHDTTPDALNRMRAHIKPYEVDIFGKPVIVLPEVWSPAYDWSSRFYVEHFPDVSGRSFLEIGCGTGVIALFAGLNGATRVVATDINPVAVDNAKRNFARFEIANAEARVSDLFEQVPGRFDVVTWNAPYHGAAPGDMLERGCTDENYADIRRFIAEVSDHLTPGGIVVFGFSESGDLPLIRRLIAEAGFTVRRELSDWREGYNCMLFELVLYAGAVEG